MNAVPIPPVRSRLQTVWNVRLSKLSVLISDGVAMTLSAGLALAISIACSEHADVEHWLGGQAVERYWAWLGMVALCLLMFLARYQHYSDRKPFWTELGEVLENLTVLALIDLALVSLTRWNSSRLWWVSVWLLSALLIPVMRALLKQVLLSRGWWQRPTVLIGSGPNAREAILALRSEPQLGFEVLGCVDVSPGLDPSDADPSDNKLPRRLHPEQVRQLAHHAGLQVVVAVEHNQSLHREQWLRLLASWKVQDVCVIPAMRGIPLYGTDISWFFSHEVALLRVRNNLRRWPARLTKRVFDVLAALLLLTLLTPVMLWLVMRIRLDGGPAIYAHQRVGHNGSLFPCYKFRSMVVDAPTQLERLLSKNPELRTQWERDHKLKDDPRISTVGHFLRKTSLDELPQLFNVLRGEMSLVGPRPIVTAELEKYGEDAEYFLMVRPGITGLWQVSGRNDVDYDTRVYLDTWYVKNWSLWYDIAILFKTVRVVLKRDGAY